MHRNASRRGFLAALAGTAAARPQSRGSEALIAITLDLEMSRNFPTWETTHWDYHKGDLNDDAKNYTVQACRRVKAAGGVVHCFLVGQGLEHESVDWLTGIIREGHPIGNHTYDHVNVKAKTLAEVQFRFRRAPWLVQGESPLEAIRKNILMNHRAMRARLGIDPDGFRTPGGFPNGLHDSPEIQQILLDMGYTWCTAMAGGPAVKPDVEPSAAHYDEIEKAQAAFQPFVYPSGLVEIPMSPPSDIHAFRNGRWKLDWFLTAIRRGVAWTIEHGAMYDFLSHPSCLGVVDPNFRTIDMICEMVHASKGRARIVGLSEFARRARAEKGA